MSEQSTILLVLPENNNKSIKLIKFLLNDHLFKLYNNENIKFKIKPFNINTKKELLKYKIYAAPYMLCQYSNNPNDDVKLTTFSEIYQWLKNLKQSIEQDNILKINTSLNNQPSIPRDLGNLPQKPYQKINNDMSFSQSNTNQPTFQMNDSEYLTKELIKNHKGEAKFDDEADAEDEDQNDQKKFEEERERRNKLQRQNDPRAHYNKNEIPHQQEYQQPFDTMQNTGDSDTDVINKLLAN